MSFHLSAGWNRFPPLGLIDRLFRKLNAEKWPHKNISGESLPESFVLKGMNGFAIP
jgi:hypothetical protein